MTPINKRRLPGNGCQAAYLDFHLKKADGSLLCEKVTTGKPNKDLINMICEQHSIDQSELPKFLMIGDNPQTDIALANNAGIDSLLVLTGTVKNLSEAQIWHSRGKMYKNTHVMQSFG